MKKDNLLIDDNYHAPLSQAIQKSYNSLMRELIAIPSDFKSKKIIEGTGGLISIADLIAYQIGWGKLLIGWYQVGLENKMPHMPGEGFDSWDYVGLAHHFYKKYHYDEREKQQQIFHDTVKELIMICEKEFKSGNLEKIGVWQWCTLKSGKDWSLQKWIQVNSVAPYKKARTLIRKFLNLSSEK